MKSVLYIFVLSKGMDDYRSFRLELCRGADVFLICFDIGRPCTLRSVEHKVHYRQEYMPLFLLHPRMHDLILPCHFAVVIRDSSRVSRRPLSLDWM